MNDRNTQISVTFEWHSLIKDILRNIWAIVLAGCIAFMGLSIYEYCFHEPSYTSSALLAVRTNAGTGGAYSGLSNASGMTSVFAEVFEQPAMKELAAENLGIDGFDGKVTAASEDGTNIMRISVTASDPEHAYRFLNSVLEVYPNISETVFSNAVIDVLSTPKMPTSPSNSITLVRQIQVIALAILFECGLVVLLSLIRNTVKNESSFEEKIDAKLVGAVVHEKSSLSFNEKLRHVKRAFLIDDPYTSLRFFEDYQRIANKLEYDHNKNGTTTYTVTGVAENEGKSTVSVNIALALAVRGYKVALLDLDVRKPSVYKIFDLKKNVKTEFSDVLAGDIPMEKFMFYRYKKSNLLIALNKTSRMDSGNWLNGNLSKSIIGAIKKQMDFVIIDSPPISASADAVNLATMSDSAILVVRTDVVPAEDINDAILTITNSGGHLMGCVLNDVYKPFTMFGQMGIGESEYYNYGSYGGYSKVVWGDVSGSDIVEDAVLQKQEKNK